MATHHELLYDLGELVIRIAKSQDFVDRVEAYYEVHHHEWSDAIASEIQDFLERKRDQIEYERHRVERMGWDIALGRNPHGPF